MKPNYDSANHPDDLVDYNLYTSNAALVGALKREGAGDAHERLDALGARLGTRAMFALGDVANRNPPALKVFASRPRASSICHTASVVGRASHALPSARTMSAT